MEYWSYIDNTGHTLITFLHCFQVSHWLPLLHCWNIADMAWNAIQSINQSTHWLQVIHWLQVSYYITLHFITLQAAKMAKYCKQQLLCELFFAVFVVVWIVTRLIIYPFRYVVWYMWCVVWCMWYGLSPDWSSTPSGMLCVVYVVWIVTRLIIYPFRYVVWCMWYG